MEQDGDTIRVNSMLDKVNSMLGDFKTESMKKKETSLVAKLKVG